MSRTKLIEGEITRDQAEEQAREAALFNDEPPVDRDDIVDISVMWVDKMNVRHDETCGGTHCRHYACRDGDVPWFCSACAP